jgi:hypothetical protein
MNNEKYLELMSALNYAYDNDEKLIICWNNGLTICCASITGEYETDTEPEDEDYIGEYAAAVEIVDVLQEGTDNSVNIYNNCVEISLKCIPEKVSLETGAVLWENNN